MSIYKSNRKQSKVVISGHQSVKKVFKGNNLLFGKESFENIFTASGSITFPATMFSLTVIVVGAGGCGGQWVLGKHGDWIGAGGGGAGGYAKRMFNNIECKSIAGKTISFVVGVIHLQAKGDDSVFMDVTAYGGQPGGPYSDAHGGVGGSATGGSENKTGASGTNGGYVVVGRGGQGWDINGTTYGDGGDSTAISSNGEGKNGCVYIRYEF